MRLSNPIKLISWFVLFESIGFLLGLFTQVNLYPWYEHLNRSSLTPPGFVFSIVWSLLYALLAVIIWRLSNLNGSGSKKFTALFVLQMLMNWSWTILFFGLHLVILSAIWLVGLSGLNLILMIKAKNMDKPIAWLLTPYFLWLVFASYLNAVIALMN